MAIAALVAGRYAVSYDGSDLGMAEKGWELEFQFKQEVIDESDLYGASTIDIIRRGCDVFVNAQLMEWTSATKGLLWNLGGGSMGVLSNAANPVGVLASSVAKALVMSSTANTPAAASPASLTAPLATLAPNYNPKINFDSRLRKFPLRMQFLPSTSTGTTTLFSTS